MIRALFLTLLGQHLHNGMAQYDSNIVAPHRELDACQCSLQVGHQNLVSYVDFFFFVNHIWERGCLGEVAGFYLLKVSIFQFSIKA